MENTGIAIGSALLPAVTALLSAVTKVIVPIAEWTAKHKTLTAVAVRRGDRDRGDGRGDRVAHKAFTGIKGAVSDAKDAFQGAKTAIKAVRDGLKALPDLASSVASGFSQVTSSLGNIASTAGSAISAAAQTAAGWVSTGAKAAWAAVQILAAKTAQLAAAAASRLLAGAQAVLNAIMDANPIMLVVVAFAALTAGVIYAWTHFETFRKVVEDVFGWLNARSRRHRVRVDPLAAHRRDHRRPPGHRRRPGRQALERHQEVVRQGVHDVKSILSWFGSLPSSLPGGSGARRTRWAVRAASAALVRAAPRQGRIIPVGFARPDAHGRREHRQGHLERPWIHGQLAGEQGQQLRVKRPRQHRARVRDRLAVEVHHRPRSVARRRDSHRHHQVHPDRGRRRQADGSSVLAATAGMRSGGIEAGSTLANSAVGPAVGGGAAGGIPVINLNVTGNYVMSDADINKLVERMGKQLATQILPSAGRKIQMRG